MNIYINKHKSTSGLFLWLFISIGVKTHFLKTALRQPLKKIYQGPYTRKVPKLILILCKPYLPVFANCAVLNHCNFEFFGPEWVI